MTVSLFVSWDIGKDYDVGATVSHGAFLYRCVKYAPAGTSVSDPNYWLTQGDGRSGDGVSNPLAVDANGGIYGDGAVNPIGVNNISSENLINLLDTAGFPTTFLLS
jgi:hypothetical protein